ncbi:MAG: GatB/YqeY domain-containing protein [Anaerolineae bacterium]
MADELNERLANDLKTAMRDHDELRKTTLRGLRAALQRAAEDKRAAAVDKEKKRRGGDLGDAPVVLDEAALALTPDESIAVVQREVKQRRDAVVEFTRGNRPDLAANEEAEILILQAYLPQQMTREEIEVAAQQAIQEVGATGPSQVGQVMKVLTPRLRGRADGRVINEVVRGLLEGK